MFLKKVTLLILPMILPLLFLATTAFALSGDPPLWGGNCDPDAPHNVNSPDFPWPISYVHKMITERKIKMWVAKVAPYTETNPQTGEKFYRMRHQPQIDAATREVEEWERRAKDKVEKYAEVDPCDKELAIRQKYIDLIW